MHLWAPRPTPAGKGEGGDPPFPPSSHPGHSVTGYLGCRPHISVVRGTRGQARVRQPESGHAHCLWTSLPRVPRLTPITQIRGQGRRGGPCSRHPASLVPTSATQDRTLGGAAPQDMKLPWARLPLDAPLPLLCSLHDPEAHSACLRYGSTVAGSGTPSPTSNLWPR